MAQHLEPARAIFQDLRDVLAHLAQDAAAGDAGAACCGQVFDVAPGQVLGQRATATAGRLLLRRVGASGCVLGVVLAACGHEIGQHVVEPQLELLDLARQALG